MDNLDTLISKFKEVKEELNKSSGLHDTVEGFMTGLKALPKGSAGRGKFITGHMNHGPFLGALQAHPQGKQVHSMLTSHLNSAANAGFKPGQVKTMAKGDEELDSELDKAIGAGFKDKNMAFDASRDAHRASMLSKPLAAKPHKATLPSPEEHASRASMFADFMPPPGVKKSATGGRMASQGGGGDVNMALSADEKISLCKNGQWELVPGKKK